jgi:hypothetical protein
MTDTQIINHQHVDIHDAQIHKLQKPRKGKKLHPRIYLIWLIREENSKKKCIITKDKVKCQNKPTIDIEKE